MNNLKNKRILIFQQRSWGRNVGHFLAKKLQAEGCKLAALTVKKSTHDFIVNQNDVKYDLIISSDEIKEDPKKFLNDNSFSLKEICKDLGINSIWPLVQSSRNHVKSYKDKYYYGYKQNLSDEEIIYFIKAIYKNIRNIFDVFKPELIIAPNFVALQHIMFNLYANKRGVKMIGMTDSKIGNIYMLVNNYKDSEGIFFDRLNDLNKGVKSDNFSKAKEYITKSKEKLITPQASSAVLIKKHKDIISLIRSELSPFYRSLRYYFFKNKNKLKNIKVNLDDLSPKYIFRDHYAKKKYIKFSNNFKYYDFNKIDKFIYFPLQFQPEQTIDVIAPHYNNQIETARRVAMSMPGDYTLVVKEHPAMVGYRPPSYTEKVSRIPNVKLIDYRISSEKVLKRTDLVISPNSTTLAEAAFLTKPGIQLGDLGTTLQLPNVFRHTDLSTLAAKIIEVLKINLKTEEYERKLLNYVSAALDTGFKYNYVEIWEKGKKENIERLWYFYKKVINYLLNRYA